MTNEEKLKAIEDRISKKGFSITRDQISLMVIIHYLGQLEKDGYVEHGYSVGKNGKDVVAICEEFDWKPSDEDIINFVVGMVEKPEQAPFAYMITRYRDDKEALYEDMRKSKADSE